MLKAVRFNSLRNAETLAFVSNILDVVKAQNFAFLATVTTDLENAFEAMSSAFKKEMGSMMTTDLKELDKKRDTAIQGILAVSKAYTMHFDENKRKAAEAIVRSIQKYSKNVATLGYQEETSTIRNIINDWGATPTLTAAITLLGISDWKAELKATNDEFDAVYVGRSQSDAQKSMQAPVSDLRKPLETQYQTLANHITAYNITTPSEALTTMTAEVNALVEKYNLAVARR
jgi:hypothetical protein